MINVPLLSFFISMIVAFGLIRLSVRLIRAQVRWWPGNITPGGLHIHHVVFGVVFLLIGGVAGLVIPVGLTGWRSAAAALLGVGAALVLDEWALILHLRDVYWSEQGRASVDAVFVAVAVVGLMLLGLRPFVVSDFLDDSWSVGAFYLLVDLGLAVVTLLKGKIWTGLVGLFVPFLLVVGAWRLARPGSPWARWRYRSGSRKLLRAENRERRYRRPIVRAKIRFQELIAGSFR